MWRRGREGGLGKRREEAIYLSLLKRQTDRHTDLQTVTVSTRLEKETEVRELQTQANGREY